MPTQPADVARRTRSNVLEYMQIFGRTADKPRSDKWQPPADSEYKINVDGSFVAGQDHAGWGVAARTAAGRLVCPRAGRTENIHDAFAAEADAMSHAINMAADLGMVRVVFETDSQLLAEALDLWMVDSSAYAAVIEDMKYQLKLLFSKFSISVCRRSANSVAHELASLGRMCDLNQCMQWDSDVPAHVGFH